MNECRSHPDICDDSQLYIFMRCAPPFDENQGVSVFVGETSALLALNLIFHKSFLRIFRFHPKQSELQTVASLQKNYSPHLYAPPALHGI